MVATNHWGFFPQLCNYVRQIFREQLDPAPIYIYKVSHSDANSWYLPHPTSCRTWIISSFTFWLPPQLFPAVLARRWSSVIALLITLVSHTEVGPFEKTLSQVSMGDRDRCSMNGHEFTLEEDKDGTYRVHELLYNSHINYLFFHVQNPLLVTTSRQLESRLKATASLQPSPASPTKPTITV